MRLFCAAYSALKRQVPSVSSYQLLWAHARVTVMYLDLHTAQVPCAAGPPCTVSKASHCRLPTALRLPAARPGLCFDMIQPTTPTKGPTDPDVAELQNRLGVPSASDRCHPDASYRYDPVSLIHLSTAVPSPAWPHTLPSQSPCARPINLRQVLQQHCRTLHYKTICAVLLVHSEPPTTDCTLALCPPHVSYGYVCSFVCVTRIYASCKCNAPTVLQDAAPCSFFASMPMAP